MLRLPLPTRIFSSFAGLLLGLAACAANVQAAPKTVCTITINSADEKESLQRHLPPGDYRFVELVSYNFV